MTIWPQPDGTPIACNEKLKVLAENEAELRSVMSDAFDDAVLMGVDPTSMRALLVGMVQTLPGPGLKAAGASRTGATGSPADGASDPGVAGFHVDDRGADGPLAHGPDTAGRLANLPGTFVLARSDGGRG